MKNKNTESKKAFELTANNWLHEQILGIEENNINIEHAEKLIKNYEESIKIQKEQNKLKLNICKKYIREISVEYKIKEKYFKFFGVK